MPSRRRTEIDDDRDGVLAEAELAAAHERAAH